jgi:hypothetical protein
MEKSSMSDANTASYQVKNIEPVMAGSDVRARLFTLAPRDVIPWHYHREAADHYFILQGELTTSTRLPEETQTASRTSLSNCAGQTSSHCQPLHCRLPILAAPGRRDIRLGESR